MTWLDLLHAYQSMAWVDPELEVARFMGPPERKG